MSNHCVFYLEMTNIPSLLQGAENGDLTQIPVEFTIDLNKDIKGGSIRKYKTVNDNQFYKVSLENLVIPNLPIEFNINNYDVDKTYVNGLNLQSFDDHKNGIDVQHSGGGSIELFKQHTDPTQNDVKFKTFNKVDFWVLVDSSKKLTIAPVIEDALYTLKHEFPAPTVGEKAVIELKHNLLSVTGASSKKYDTKYKAHVIGGNGDATVLLKDAATTGVYPLSAMDANSAEGTINVNFGTFDSLEKTFTTSGSTQTGYTGQLLFTPSTADNTFLSFKFSIQPGTIGWFAGFYPMTHPNVTVPTAGVIENWGTMICIQYVNGVLRFRNHVDGTYETISFNLTSDNIFEFIYDDDTVYVKIDGVDIPSFTYDVGSEVTMYPKMEFYTSKDDPASVLSATNIEVNNATHRASASSESLPDWKAWKAFNQTVGGEGWRTDNPYMYDSNNGEYYTVYGEVSTTYDGSSTVSGEWIQLQFTTGGGITTNKIEIAPQTNSVGSCAGAGIILGSTDGSTWTSIATFSGKTYTNGNYTSITFPTSPIYTYFRLVVTKLASTGHTALNISEIRYTEVVDGIDIVLTNIGTGYTALPEIIIMDNDTGVQEDLLSFFDSVALKMKFVLPQIITSGTSGYGYTAEDDPSATTPIILRNKISDTSISVAPLWSVDSVKLLSQPAHDITSIQTPKLQPNTENADLNDLGGLITLSNPVMRFINNIAHPFILPYLYVSLSNSSTNVVNFLSNNPSTCEKHFRVLIDDESYTRPHLFFRSCASYIDYYTDLTHPIKFSLFLPNGEPLKYKPVIDDKTTDWNRKQLSALFKFETWEKSTGQICMRHTGSDQM